MVPMVVYGPSVRIYDPYAWSSMVHMGMVGPYIWCGIYMVWYIWCGIYVAVWCAVYMVHVAVYGP